MKHLSASGKYECSVVSDILDANDSRNSISFLPIRSSKRFLSVSACVAVSTDSSKQSLIPIYVDLFEATNALKDIRDQLKSQVNWLENFVQNKNFLFEK